MLKYLPLLVLSAGSGTWLGASAQTPLLLFNAGRALGRQANQLAAARPVGTQEYAGRHYALQRTPAAQLPPHEAELVTAVETQLEYCRAALLASPTEPVCPPEQRLAIHDALANLVRARLHWSSEAYEAELRFYIDEGVRRASATAPAR